MALDECLSTCQIDVNLLPLKLPIVLSILGFSSFEIMTGLSTFPKDETLIPLISSTAKLLTFSLRHERTILRFLLFNLREYDSPYLNVMINSFTIPQSNYTLICNTIASLNMVNIEEFDSGRSYDLTGVLITILRVVDYFNIYSTNHGVGHLHPLFNVISAVYYRVDTFISVSRRFLSSAPLHMLWGFTEELSSLAKDSKPNTGKHVSTFVSIPGFFTYDTNTPSEWSGFRTFCERFATRLHDIILSSFETQVNSFFAGGLAALIDQESVPGGQQALKYEEQASEREKTEKRQKDDKKEAPTLSHLIAGTEALIQNRAATLAIGTAEDYFATLFEGLRFIGSVEAFDAHLNLLPDLLTIVKELPAKLLSAPIPPADLLQNLDSVIYIMQLSYAAAGRCPNDAVNGAIATLTQCSIAGSGDRGDDVVVSGEPGPLVKMYLSEYESLLKEVLPNTSYSTSSEVFIPREGAQLKVNPAAYLGRSALIDLKKVIGITGMIALDIMSADVAKELCNKLNESLMPILMKAPTIPTDKSSFTGAAKGITEVTVMTDILHVCAVLQFRKLIRMAVGECIDYPYMTINLPPQRDSIMTSRLDKSQFIESFKNPSTPRVWYDLWSSEIGTQVKYYPDHDSFNNNIHLFALLTDAAIGTIQRKSHNFTEEKLEQYYNEYTNFLVVGIMRGTEKFKDNKKLEYKTPIMYIALDHFIRASAYADYKMLEKKFPYHFIRSYYSRFLKRITSDHK